MTVRAGRRSVFPEQLSSILIPVQEGFTVASDRQYLEFVLDQLSDLDGITYKAMMGEFILFYQGKIVGGIYDDRFLVKQTPAAKRLMPDAPLELPYEGAKEMILVDSVDNRAFLTELLNAMVDELPAPKKKADKKDRRLEGPESARSAKEKKT